MNEMLALVLTMGAYQVGLWCQKKWKSPLLNPILIGVVLVMGVLLVGRIPVEQYRATTVWYRWLLTPATVCLALPLYEQLKALKKNLPAILAGIAAGTVVSLGTILVLCRLFRLEAQVSVSLLPKSITTAMGVVLSESNGGLASLTTAAIIVTGILGSFLGPWLCKLLKLKDPIAQGVAFGTASHVIGTAKARELGAVQGAVGSLSLAVAGILTAVLFPLALGLL